MKTKPFDLVGRIMDYESDQLDDEKTIELFQHLVDNRMLSGLQGHYGRTATMMIQAGVIKRPGERRHEIDQK